VKSSDDKLLRNLKFLEQVKRAALDNKDVPPPYDRSDLYQTQMFTLGVVQVLMSRGYTIEKKDESR
jgi:hypothetical protein